MELTFLGTRGGIEIRSRRHRLRSALLVEQGDVRIMIDCSADWLHRLHAIAPSTIVLTHAHADHAAGLVKGAPCPVYATAATWGLLSRLPIRDRRTMPLREAVVIGGIRVSAIPVQLSMRAMTSTSGRSQPRRRNEVAASRSTPLRTAWTSTTSTSTPPRRRRP